MKIYFYSIILHQSSSVMVTCGERAILLVPTGGRDFLFSALFLGIEPSGVTREYRPALGPGGKLSMWIYVINFQPLSVARLVWLEDRFLLDPKLLIPKLLLDFLMFITLVAFLKGKTCLLFNFKLKGLTSVN